MKNKATKKKVLESDLVKYARQVGIIECEIPQLVFNNKDIQAIDNTLADTLGLHKARPIKKIAHYGMSSIYTRTIMVELMMRENRSIQQLRNTLIHELIHYRFHFLKHGPIFDKMIKEVLKGQQFPRKVIDVPQLYRRIKKGC